MISRYSRKEMEDIWSDQSRYELWLQVEAALAQAQEKEKVIPSGVAEKIKKANISVPRILEIEEETRHDVIAFTTSITEQMGEEGRWLHFGVTSSDILDTALALQIQNSGKLIKKGMAEVGQALKKLADENKDLLSIGRSHGIHGEYTSFGLRFLSFWAEWKRGEDRVLGALENLRYGQFSGAMGNFTTLSPSIEENACKALNLQHEPISTQVIPRDRHAEFFTSVSILASTLERISVELRHLQRTEVHEVEEGFAKGQKGSSAMPHKKNPISGENLTGVARMLRSSIHGALENMVLWHERDISHSSFERVYFPDTCILLDYGLVRLAKLLNGLGVKKEEVTKNRGLLRGVPLSGIVLLDLVQKGWSREKAYGAVQKAAHGAWDQKKDFFEILGTDSEVTSVLGKNLKETYGDERFLKNTQKIYERVYETYEK